MLKLLELVKWHYERNRDLSQLDRPMGPVGTAGSYEQQSAELTGDPVPGIPDFYTNDQYANPRDLALRARIRQELRNDINKHDQQQRAQQRNVE
jgi:hypothetical protein